MDSGVIESVREVAIPVLKSEGMELVDIEYRRESRGWVLRLFIDKEGGVTLNDCTSVSHQVGDLIEVKEIINHPYTLEVSSPGVNRPLKSLGDFERFKGKHIKIKVRQPIEGQRNFRGILLGHEQENVTISSDSRIYIIPYEDIVKASLVNNL
jgi:ribosome maturation factor RimP